MNEQIKSEVFHGACPHDCPDTCGWTITCATASWSTRGKKEHPYTRGGLCVKLKDFHDHHYNPDRLLYPLRRVGAKGSGPNGGNNFERITWDEAISEIGKRWREIIATYGSQAIMPQSYLGNMGPQASTGRSVFQPTRHDGK